MLRTLPHSLRPLTTFSRSRPSLIVHHHSIKATMTTTPAVNPATLFSSPVRAIWNVQGENVPTLWWPAKGQLPSSKDANEGESHHTVLFMLPGNPGLIDYYI